MFTSKLESQPLSYVQLCSMKAESFLVACQCIAFSRIDEKLPVILKRSNHHHQPHVKYAINILLKRDFCFARQELLARTPTTHKGLKQKEEDSSALYENDVSS